MSTAATVTDVDPAALARLRAHPMVIPSSAVKVKEVTGRSRYGSVHLGRFKTKLVCLKVSVYDDCVWLSYNDTCHGLVTVGGCSDRHRVFCTVQPLPPGLLSFGDEADTVGSGSAPGELDVWVLQKQAHCVLTLHRRMATTHV
jgi:hypothetical protein